MESEKRRIFSIKDIREYLGLTQEEFGALAGVTGVYISQIERDIRPFTDEAAKKIVKAFIRLKHEKPSKAEREINNEWIVNFYAYDIKWHHKASFYPEDVRKRIVLLADKKSDIETELDYIITTGELIGENDYPAQFDVEWRGPKQEYPLIYEEIIKYYGDEVEKNIRQFKMSYSFKKAKFPFTEEWIKKGFIKE